ncbi:MAG: hypothetical protein P1P69_08400 [Methanosarcinaceae archaeon]|nr:hypothetical protein [Methanosarcinaceae archaeon]
MKIDQLVHLSAIIIVFALFAVSVSICVNITSAQTEDEIEWLDAEEYTLYWGDKVNVSGYIIESIEYSTPRYSDVPDDYVLLSILMTNTSKSWSTILSVNNSNIPGYDIFDGKFKIEVIDIVTGINIPSPYTKIKFYLAKELPPEEYAKRTWINTTVSMEKSAGYEIYIDERAYVTIEIENLKDIYFEDVRLNENIPDNFILDPDEDIGWTFDLKNNSKLTFRYGLKSTRAGKFTIPATELMLTHLGITHYKYTNPTNLTIHGPSIYISKTIDPVPSNETLSNVTSPILLNDMINIIVHIENKGDRAAHVYISDEIPAGTTKISGETSSDMVLQPSRNYTMQYSIKMDRIGDITIPSAKAKFMDAKGYGDTVESKKQIISVIEEQILEEVEPVQEIKIENETSQPKEQKVETEQSLVDKVKSLPPKAMELPGFSGLGFVFAILSAGSVAGKKIIFTNVGTNKRKK